MSALRYTIGGFMLDGKRITANEAIIALIARVDDLEADQFEHIGALHALGAGRCDTTKKWFLESQLIRAGDRTQSLGAFDPDHFYSEFDDEKQGQSNLVELFRNIQRRGLNELLAKFPRDETGALIEPYLSAYKAAARQRCPN
tara:strand:+ start:170 stop:598 length:429 start_codon:yes stop_codon:yes gene_type:complete